MVWPSMMSLEPPPVTPSLKLPPFLGVPVAVVPPPPLELLLLPPHAASVPASASPPAPMRSSRRDMGRLSRLSSRSGRLFAISVSFLGPGAVRSRTGDDPACPRTCQATRATAVWALRRSYREHDA